VRFNSQRFKNGIAVRTGEPPHGHEADPHGSPLGSKGVGELGISGAGAAVMNAIHNATGARIRDFPATPDKLIAALERLDR
jgi:xanthine dehydrogenase YagR molybdenum-binding subunit